jgi:addiction module HigA family antidote
MPTKTAEHPGQYVWDKILAPHGLNVRTAAAALGVHRVTLSEFLNGWNSLSCEMALRLETVFGADSKMLLHKQLEYDLEQNRRKIKSLCLRPIRKTTAIVSAAA